MKISSGNHSATIRRKVKEGKMTDKEKEKIAIEYLSRLSTEDKLRLVSIAEKLQREKE